MQKQILIVDDDEDDCDLFSEAALEVDAEFQIRTAFNARGAYQLLETGYKPDIIFLDLNMPLTDGKSCLREFRKMELLAHTPVVIYSTSKRQEDKDRLMDMGANYFLTKPASLDELCAEISSLVSRDWTESTTDD